MKVKDILFKAKSIEDNNSVYAYSAWVIGDFYRNETQSQIIYSWAINSDFEPKIYIAKKVDPETLCMFTGFKDKSGKKIWEGDILEHTQSHARFTVIFDRGAFFIRRNGTESTDIYLFELSERDSCLQFFEVVGNKFDTDDSLESVFKPKEQ